MGAYGLGQSQILSPGMMQHLWELLAARDLPIGRPANVQSPRGTTQKIDDQQYLLTAGHTILYEYDKQPRLYMFSSNELNLHEEFPNLNRIKDLNA